MQCFGTEGVHNAKKILVPMKSMIIGSAHACNMNTNYMEKIVEGSDDANCYGSNCQCRLLKCC